MSDSKILLQIGACFCVLIGALYTVLTVQFLFPTPSVSALQALFLIIYTLVSFVPFAALVFPGLKTPRKSVFWAVLVIEALVLGLFFWSVLTD